MRNKKRLIIAVVLVISLALTGCGGDNQPTQPTPPPSAPSVGAPTAPAPASAVDDSGETADAPTFPIGRWHNDGQDGHMLEFFADGTLTVHIWEVIIPHTWIIEGDTLSVFLEGELSTSNEFSVSRDAFTMYTMPPTGVMQPIHFSRLADNYDWAAFVAENAPSTHPAQSLQSAAPAETVQPPAEAPANNEMALEDIRGESFIGRMAEAGAHSEITSVQGGRVGFAASTHSAQTFIGRMAEAGTHSEITSVQGGRVGFATSTHSVQTFIARMAEAGAHSEITGVQGGRVGFAASTHSAQEFIARMAEAGAHSEITGVQGGRVGFARSTHSAH